MKRKIQQPDYGPSHFTLELEIEPSFKDYLDGSLYLLFFLPIEMFLRVISLLPVFFDRKEKAAGQVSRPGGKLPFIHS